MRHAFNGRTDPEGRELRDPKWSHQTMLFAALLDSAAMWGGEECMACAETLPPDCRCRQPGCLIAAGWEALG